MSVYLYLGLLALVAVERLFETRLSRKNARLSVAAGGREFGAGHFPVMVFLHTSFLFACAAEVVFLHRPFIAWLGFSALAVEVAAQALRYWAVSTLGSRWNVRIFVIPNAAPVSDGPYRFVRHPNYVAVVLDLIALPLIHGAWVTALVFSLANAALLVVRIGAEEKAFGTIYQETFKDRPRFLPSAEHRS